LSSARTTDTCFFCSCRTLETIPVLVTTDLAMLVVNSFPYAVGHVMAAPTRHRSNIEEAPLDEVSDVFALVQRAIRAIQRVYNADGFNIGLNQGRIAGAAIPGHYHVHVVPRWNGDTSFMPVIAGTRVIPEAIEITFQRLVAALA